MGDLFSDSNCCAVARASLTSPRSLLLAENTSERTSVVKCRKIFTLAVAMVGAI